MKIGKLIFALLLTVVAAIYVISSSRVYSTVTSGDTQLCIPKQYEVFIDVPWLAAVTGDHEARSAVYEIPASEIKAAIPAYTERHINRYDVDYEHDISGTFWSTSAVGKPNGSALAAWHIAQEFDDVTVRYNKHVNAYELADSLSIDFLWYLARTPPQADTALPENWYLGYCSGKKPLDFSCSRNMRFNDLYFDYQLEAHDIHLVDEIEAFLLAKFTSWQKGCEAK